MASRKRLSDLLREEAKRSPDANAAAEEQSAQTSASSTKGGTRSKSAKPSDTEADAPADTAAETGDVSEAIAATPSPAQVELESALEELRSQLQSAKAQEGVLQRQIESLQADLSEQQALMQKLKADLEHSSQLKNELEEARNVILRLSELNTKLEGQVRAATAPPPPTPKSEVRHIPEHTQIELRRAMQHPVLPVPPSTMLTNDDIGWVD